MTVSRIKKEGSSGAKFPPQKKSTSEKGKSFGIECIEGAENLALFSSHEIRQSYYNKKKNYDLANDIIDLKDVESVCSPLGLDMSTFPATMQNYPLANPKIKLLMGEEMKRPFEFRVRSTNPNTANKKEEAYKNDILEYAMNNISKEGLDEKQVTIEMDKIKRYYDYTYQDFHEKMASDILSYFWKEQDLSDKFSKGFQDALIAGEEIYRIDIVAGEPVVVKCNPLNIFTYGMGESPYLDDADIIIEDTYVSIGKVIDEFYEYLKPEDINELEEQRTNKTGSRSSTGDTLNYKNFFPQLLSSTFTGESFTVSSNEGRNRFGGYRDDAGNIRVTRVVWKSRRKIGKLTYYDEFGDMQHTIVDEYYKPNKLENESVKWLWVNEYWEGTRIGKDLYVKIQPRPIQFRSINNLSKCKSGYVGTAYNINSSRARSLYDQMKPYQYLYNIFMYRTELAFAKYKGPIMEINAAAIPDDMDLEEWLYYAEVTGYALMDPFNESKKGPSQGTLAGSMNTVGGKILSDDSIGNYIQSNIQMLRYIEEQLGSISGVSQQRQGQIETRELVGNVERAVSQSAHITEPWFHTHEHVKLRVLNVLLETAKYCFKDETDKRLQFVTDDMSTITINVDGKMLNESEYSVFVNSGMRDLEFEQALKQLAQAGLQSGKLNFADVVKVYQANNMTDKAKLIEEAEAKKAQSDAEQQQKQQEHEQQLQQAQQQAAQELAKMQIENREDEQAAKLEEIKVKAEEERKTLLLKSQVENELTANAKDLEREKLRINKEIEQEKLKLEKEISENQLRVKQKELDATLAFKRQESNNKLKVEREKMIADRKARNKNNSK